ncbi:MAG: site-specific DNA-methyltransferase [Gemmataceae bacterium]|nr:site-specific DNA-methyltransferase [Gemmataceae bacterium]
MEEREEKFGLHWHGKRRARQLALTPSTGTLRPCPEESVDWETTQNLMIEGDNLEVLKLLQKSYAGKVKLIYIDPPYNTGKDFVYPDNFQDNIRNYLEITGQVGDGQKTTSNVEVSGRFHTNWLNMIYPRLKLARNLLRDDGILCISIDDTEEANLRKVCDEIFGEENHVANIVWQKRYVSNVTAKWLSDMHDFVVLYARNRDQLKVATWERSDEQLEAYRNPDNDPRGNWRAQDLSAGKPYSAGQFTIEGPTGLQFNPPPNRYWRCNREQFDKWIADGRIWWGVNKDARPMLKSFLAEVERGITPNTWWDYNFAGHNKEATLELKELFSGSAPFDTPKPVKLVRRLFELFCSGDDIVLDFFAGSGTFGHAAIEVFVAANTSLRHISVQLPEPIDHPQYGTIAEVTKERLRLAGKKLREQNPLFQGDLGFRVFKLASSNIREWEPDRANLARTLEEHAVHLREDRTEADILFEVLLKLGLDLTVPIETKTIAGKTVHSVGAGSLLVCLAKTIAARDVEPLALGIAEWHKIQNPTGESTLVFRDSAFADDVSKTNLTAILQQHGLDNVRSL